MADLKATWAKLKKRPDPLTSIALTIPVFLVYQLCILIVDRRSRSDFVSDPVLSMLDPKYYPVYVIGALTLALGLATVTWIEERRGAVSGVPLGKVVLEGLAFALIALVVLGLAPRRFVRPTEPAMHADGVFEAIVLSAGAGLYQELIFRAVLVTLFSAVLALVFRVSKRVALGIAITLSSVAFAITHHYGPHGEPFGFDVATYHVLLAGLFAGLYLTRGFAVAVYAHVFFEIGVHFMRA